MADIPVLVRDPEQFLSAQIEKIAQWEAQTARTIASIQQQLERKDLLAQTQERCRSMITAIHQQTADVRGVIGPLLAAAGGTSASEANAELGLLTYLNYLYRDWGWPIEANGENERLFEMVQSLLMKQLTGRRLLVLGAGGCRLAYEIHRYSRNSETTVLDLDPLLFLAAQRLIRGGTIRILEANAEIHSTDAIIKQWILQAPHGAIGKDEFHFMFANALEPPFAQATFDTVLTPWFIDIAPVDLRNLIAQIYRVLKPGGRWLNIGPLRYRSSVPIAQRFTQQEIFSLIARSGFRLESSHSESMPYLVSKLNQRGKVEWVLAFAAIKLESFQMTETPPHPPSWLLLPHLPVPIFPGLETLSLEDPAEQIVASAIDGTNSINEIALRLAAQAGEVDLSMDQLREIVRRCLIELHPYC